MEDVAQRIKKLRDHLNFTQLELGKAASVSKAAVSQWERGISTPQRDALYNLQYNAGINPRWVSEGEGEMMLSASRMSVAEAEEAYQIDPKINELTSLFIGLPMEAKNQILSLAKYLSKITGKR